MMGLERPLRIVVGEDHRLLADAYALILQPVGEVVATVTGGRALFDAVVAHAPDLVLTDLSMPDGSGFEAIRRITALESPPSVIVVTVRDDFSAARAVLDAGARGFVVKSAASDELLTAVRTVIGGGTYLSPLVAENPMPLLPSPLDALTSRELEVLLLVAQGLSAKQIAVRLGIAERTVNFHKERMKQRLGVKPTIEAVNLLRAEGIRPS